MDRWRRRRLRVLGQPVNSPAQIFMVRRHPLLVHVKHKVVRLPPAVFVPADGRAQELMAGIVCWLPVFHEGVVPVDAQLLFIIRHGQGQNLAVEVILARATEAEELDDGAHGREHAVRRLKLGGLDAALALGRPLARDKGEVHVVGGEEERLLGVVCVTHERGEFLELLLTKGQVLETHCVVGSWQSRAQREAPSPVLIVALSQVVLLFRDLESGKGGRDSGKDERREILDDGGPVLCLMRPPEGGCECCGQSL